MPRPNKFKRGAIITDPTIAISIALDGRWIYLGSVPRHPAFIVGMPIRAVADLVKQRRVAFAMPNPDHPDNKEGS